MPAKLEIGNYNIRSNYNSSVKYRTDLFLVALNLLFYYLASILL